MVDALAVVFAFFIILFALPLLLFRIPISEIFSGLTGQKDEIALTNGVVKIEQGLPDEIINSREENERAPADKIFTGKLPRNHGGEMMDGDPGLANNKPADIETAEIVSPEESEDQLKEKASIEKKFLVYFGQDSTAPDSRLFKTLTEIVDLLPLYPDAKIFIESYTDSNGDYFYNKKISQLRANIIKTFFEGQGIAESRISAIVMGPENPIADNATREGRTKNRRVEIRLKQ